MSPLEVTSRAVVADAIAPVSTNAKAQAHTSQIKSTLKFLEMGFVCILGDR